jgi:hypothetical protein
MKLFSIISYIRRKHNLITMRILILLLACLFCSINVIGQDTITTKVIVFDQDDMSKFDTKKEYGKNALKINPLLITSGEIPIYYERALNKSLSAEIAIGITYKDYMGDLLDDSDNDFSDSETDQVHPNISFKTGLRFYTGGEALDGFYFAVEYAKRKYATTKEVTAYSVSSMSLNTLFLKEENSINEFKLIVGSQTHNYWDNFFVDYYGGVGIKNQDKIVINLEQDALGNDIYQLVPRKKSGPAIYLGLKFGFEF